MSRDDPWTDNNWVISTCQKSMKIWDGETGKPVTAVEPPARINHSVILENTGLAFMALEQEKMQGYFLPTLGPAPRWCSFLDNLTEELEENETDTLYDDYKFLTLEEVCTNSKNSILVTISVTNIQNVTDNNAAELDRLNLHVKK